MYLQGHKRFKFHHEITTPLSDYGKSNQSSDVVDYSDPYALSEFLEDMDNGKYGSVTKEVEAIKSERIQVLSHLAAASKASEDDPSAFSEPSSTGKKHTNPVQLDVIDLGDDEEEVSAAFGSLKSVILVDSDEEDTEHQAGKEHVSSLEQEAQEFRTSMASQIQNQIKHARALAQEAHCNQLVPYVKLDSNWAFKPLWQPVTLYQKVILQKVPEGQRFQHLVNENDAVSIATREDSKSPNIGISAKRYTKKYEKITGKRKDVGYVNGEKEKEPVENQIPASPSSLHDSVSSMGRYEENEKEASPSDGLEDLWKDMSLAMECSKSATADEPVAPQEDEDCCHSYFLQDDIGLVCRVCGIIQKPIETIFDYQWTKGSQSIRTHLSGSRNPKDQDEVVHFVRPKMPEDDFSAAEISIHPRHSKQLKPHQLEGFNFLVKNLVTDKPGGCILAHSPGSGKTFMLISFIQSFLAKYPSSRPLVVLPKGILPTWKKEFLRWQVEDMPLYDFYSVKAENRSQQLEVLKQWQENKSILFLGYKQFSTIIRSEEKNNAATACQEVLLKVPGLLILDEGHTARNEDTNVLDSLAKVQTPRKVVLSGTIFQNHVKEVFTVLNLVRPKFLRTESSRAIVKRLMSRLRISGGRRLYKGGVDNTFYELVEENLQDSGNFERKITVIQDLREMTKDVLHYYKGDFLDELPGLFDFTVVLNLTAKQKALVHKLAKYEKFKRISVGSAVYMHPQLYDTAEKAAGDRAGFFNDEKVDSLLDLINVRDGVKTKFFLNILSLAEAAGEKLLVFSQYILPLKYLERVIVKTKGWHLGKEIFMISGDSSSDLREWSMEQFNNSADAKVFFGSIKACGEGISLVGASRIVILDVHLNPSVTRQAIGRAFRPGQTKKVYTYRLVAADSPEEEDHNTSFSKELISKMWFEWSQFSGLHDFELDSVDINSCKDMFLESPILQDDIKALYRR